VEEGFRAAAVEAGFGVGSVAEAGLIDASEEEGFRAAAGMPLEWTAEEGVREGAAMMTGFERGAAARAGFFCASSEEEGFVRATEKGGEAGAATMAVFGRGAVTMAGLFCASSEEEGFARATEMEVGARRWRALGEVPRRRRACSLPPTRRAL
jgi:hypothetical protein